MASHIVRGFAVDKENRVTALRLGYTSIADLSNLSPLDGLTNLDLTGCRCITDFAFLKELESLTSLYLSDNNLSDVTFLKELKSLTLLDLSDNNLSDVTFIAELNNLDIVHLIGNPIKEPPEKVVGQGLEAMRSYFRESGAGTEEIYEAKVLLVGEPGAGKTSLMNKFLDHDYQVDPQRPHDATLGIVISPNWTFPHPAQTRITFKAHLWDFGGQNIQYYIHQFFLTERSLYVLLVDDREDCQNIDYWFDIIKLLGKGSPVLLVRNQKNISSVTGFDAIKYQKRYGPHFETVFREVNLADQTDKHRFLEIEREAQKLVSSLPHVGQALPITWVKVRQALTRLKEAGKNHIPLSQYQKICLENQIEEEKDQLVLSDYLHALGAVVFYRNDEILGNTIFLNPDWITKAVYTILSDKELAWIIHKVPKAAIETMK